MDRTADALATFSETVALRREPSGGGLQKLGAALWVVARCQVALGQRQAAHATALEMLGTFRQVADDVPGSTDTLACAFAFLSSQESALGLEMEALRSAEVAVDLSTDDGPRTAAGPGVLAYALASLGSAQSAAGREQDALATTRKAVEHYRTLADTNPASFRQKLVEVLLDQVLQQFRLGLLEEARATAEEAVAIGRRLVSESPPHDSDRHRTHLATSLHNLALAQDSLGQLEPALETFKAAIDVARAVTVGKPRESLGTLVNLLSNLAAHYYRVGLHREAHRVGVEATALARDFAAATPDLGLPFLARNLNHLCVFLSNLGMRAEAIETGREGLVLCRKLHAEHPQQHGGRLAQALINLAHALEAVGGHEEASGLFAEEVALRGADAGRPPAVRGSLAVSLIQMME
jgi:tetratricopeptide (TPR) repeat protein